MSIITNIIRAIRRFFDPTITSAVADLNRAVNALQTVADNAFEDCKTHDAAITQAVNARNEAAAVAERAVRVQEKLSDLLS